MEYYIDFFSNYNNSYIFMAMLTTFFNFSFFLLNQNDKKYPLDTYDSNPRADTRIGEAAPKGGGSDRGDIGAAAVRSGDLDFGPSTSSRPRVTEAGRRAVGLAAARSCEPYSGSSSDGETSDLDYEPYSGSSSDGETSSVSISEGDLDESSCDPGTGRADSRSEGADPDYKQSTDSEGGDSLTSSLCCPCFTNTSPNAPSGSYLDESQLSDLYSNYSFYSIDSEDEEKIKKIRLKMRSLKLEIKNIKLSALNKSNLSNSIVASIQI